MKIASLFSGIGALDLGFQQAGHEIILQVEKDTHCKKILQRHFPSSIFVDDVSALLELPEDTDGLIAGFPCTVSMPSLSNCVLRTDFGKFSGC